MNNIFIEFKFYLKSFKKIGTIFKILWRDQIFEANRVIIIGHEQKKKIEEE